MTKQNYEKPNMEIVVLEDVIKTSGGPGWGSNATLCMGGDTGTGCNPDTICNDTGTGCNSYSVCTLEWAPCSAYSIGNVTKP